MAYTIGKYGPAALGNLVGLIAVFYLTAALFVVVVNIAMDLLYVLIDPRLRRAAK